MKFEGFIVIFMFFLTNFTNGLNLAGFDSILYKYVVNVFMRL